MFFALFIIKTVFRLYPYHSIFARYSLIFSRIVAKIFNCDILIWNVNIYLRGLLMNFEIINTRRNNKIYTNGIDTYKVFNENYDKRVVF